MKTKNKSASQVEPMLVKIFGIICLILLMLVFIFLVLMYEAAGTEGLIFSVVAFLCFYSYFTKKGRELRK